MERHLPKHVDRAVADFLIDTSNGVRRERFQRLTDERMAALTEAANEEDNHGNAADQT